MKIKRPKSSALRASSPRVTKDVARDSEILRMVNERLVISALRDRNEAENARSVIDEFPDAVARFDSNFRHVYANDASAAMAGVPRSELVGKTHGELEISHELAGDWSDLLRRVVATGEPTEKTIHVESSVGLRVFRLRAFPEKEHGRPIATVTTIARDVTDSEVVHGVREEIRWLLRIQSATAAFAGTRTIRGTSRALVGHARVSLDATSSLVWLRDDERDLLRLESSAGCSHEAIALWNDVPLGGLSPIARSVHTGRTIALDTLVGETAPDLVAARGLGYRAIYVVPIVIEERMFGALATLFRVEREFRPVEFEFLTLLAVQASQSFERALADRVERSARRESEIACRLKDDFLATMSHELRTPLNAVVGWTAILRQPGREPAELDRGLAAIERNARIQARLVDDVLDVSRISAGKLEMRKERVDVSALVLAAVEDVQHATDFAGVEIRTSLAERAYVEADPARIQQVAWNLLANAVKFTPDDGCIDVTVSTSGARVVLEVVDTGIGIAPESISQIFDRFRQLKRDRVRGGGGLGLGLAIVRHLVEAHGGTVVASSPGVGLGTRFVVELPAMGPEVVPEDEALTVLRGSREWRDVRLDGVRLLLVDDDPDALDITSIALESLGADVDVATNAAEALEFLANARADVLICDLGMPDVDGFELIRRVRELGGRSSKNLPVIALTGFLLDDDRRRSREAGFDAHVAKPIDYDELVREIVRLSREH